MTDLDPDAPEDVWDFWRRFMDSWHGSDKETDCNAVWEQFGLPEYHEQEKAKELRRKARQQELNEYQRTVDQLNAQIEREQQRLRREEARKREREANDAKRKLEAEAAAEERDPTPIFESVPPPIPYDIRSRHIYVPGGTQRGKSTLLHSIIFRDIMEGNGVAVLDPKRDLLRLLVHSLPKTRIVDGAERNILDDIVYLDLKTPIPLNFLDRDPDETERVVNDLIYIVTKGDENLKAAEPLLEKIIRTFLIIPDTTITDMYRFIALPDVRKTILSNLEPIDPELAKLWVPFPKEGVATLERRLSAFYFNPQLKAIFDAHTPPLDIKEILDSKKILLVDLSPPQDKNASLFGALIIAQIMSAINQRSQLPKYRRIPFYLHVDEFELCQTASFAGLLSVAGGLGLRLTLGNQYLGQVLDQNLAAILGNNPTYVFFQLSDKDASQFRSVVAPYKTERLAQLEPHHACFKVGSNPPIFAKTKRLHIMTDSDEEDAEGMLPALRAATIARYCERTNAQSNPLRTVDSEACNSAPVPHHEVNGNSTLQDQPTAGRPPNVPPHDGKKGNSRNTS